MTQGIQRNFQVLSIIKLSFGNTADYFWIWIISRFIRDRGTAI